MREAAAGGEAPLKSGVREDRHRRNHLPFNIALVDFVQAVYEQSRSTREMLTLYVGPKLDRYVISPPPPNGL